MVKGAYATEHGSSDDIDRAIHRCQVPYMYYVADLIFTAINILTNLIFNGFYFCCLAIYLHGWKNNCTVFLPGDQ